MDRKLLPSLRETFTDQHSLLEPRSYGFRLLEEYRSLYTAALERTGSQASVVLGVTSPMPREGKTTVATNIAGAMAADLEKRVLLTSCAFSSAGPDTPSQPVRPGLAEFASDPTRDLDELLVRTPLSNLSVLFPGARPENPSRVLRSERMQQVIALFRERFDITVVDLMPMLSASDAQVMAGLMDGVLLVVGLGETSIGAVQRAVRLVPAGRLIGIAANRTQPVLPPWMTRILGGSEWGP